MILSSFQRKYAAALERAPDFRGWCVHPIHMISSPSPEGKPPRPKLLTYYTKDGTLHADRVSDITVLAQILFPATQGGSNG